MTPLKTLAQPSNCTGDTWSWRRTTPSPPPWPPCTRLESSCSGRFQKTDFWPHRTICTQSLCEGMCRYFLSPYPTQPLLYLNNCYALPKCCSRFWLWWMFGFIDTFVTPQPYWNLIRPSCTVLFLYEGHAYIIFITIRSKALCWYLK